MDAKSTDRWSNTCTKVAFKWRIGQLTSWRVDASRALDLHRTRDRVKAARSSLGSGINLKEIMTHNWRPWSPRDRDPIATRSLLDRRLIVTHLPPDRGHDCLALMAHDRRAIVAISRPPTGFNGPQFSWKFPFKNRCILSCSLNSWWIR